MVPALQGASRLLPEVQVAILEQATPAEKGRRAQIAMLVTLLRPGQSAILTRMQSGNDDEVIEIKILGVQPINGSAKIGILAPPQYRIRLDKPARTDRHKPGETR